jgi:hypothetical protein
MNNQFDSDTRALTRRLKTNVAGAERDIEGWIIGEVRPRAGMRILLTEAEATRSLCTRYPGMLQHNARIGAAGPAGNRPA